MITYHKKQANFSVPNSKVELKYRPELQNWDGKYFKLVQSAGKLWIIKGPLSSQNYKRELLVYSLAKGLVNAAEIKKLNDDEVNELRNLNLITDKMSPLNTILVRLAQDYSLEELPVKSLDYAMAGELVLSLWVRRHDVSKWNRAYTKYGIPVFFDYQASLNCEPMLFDSDTFFAKTRVGYAGSWRVAERKDIPLSILNFRNQLNCPNYINDKNSFNHAIDEIVAKIRSLNIKFRHLIKEAGFDGEEVKMLNNFLKLSTKDLPNDVEKMKKVIFSTSPDIIEKSI